MERKTIAYVDYKETAIDLETTDKVFSEVSKLMQRIWSQWPFVDLAADWLINKGLLDEASEVETPALLRFLDAYSEQIENYGAADFSKFLDDKVWLESKISQRRQEILFDDPIILLVYWIVSKEEQDFPEHWPFDLSLLRPVFTDLGIAEDGCLD